jgi:hypothetical protein
MAEKQNLLCDQRRLVLAGIPYTISVRVEDGTFRAKWFCGACSNQNGVRLEGPTAEAAIDAASADLMTHQTDAHEKS